MSTNFPTSIDALTNPTATDKVSVVTHSTQHANANDAIEALEAKVGADSSAVTTSHDYKLGEVTGSDKSVGKSATQTLTNKTLTTPTIGSFANAGHNHQDSAGGGTLNASAIAAGTLALGRGGTGGSLVNPNADRIFFWDDSAGVGEWLTVGTGLSIAGTTLNATGILPTCVTSVPKPLPSYIATGNVTLSVNTTQYLYLANVAAEIIVNKIVLDVNTVTTPGTIDVTIYSEDGQTQKIAVTSGTISATGINTIAVSAVTLPAGNYYIAINTNSTTNIALNKYTAQAFFRDPSSEPVLAGTLAISAGTPSSTFTPSSITVGTDMPMIRFDN